MIWRALGVALLAAAVAVGAEYAPTPGAAALAWALQHGAPANAMVALYDDGRIADWPEGVERPPAGWVLEASNQVTAAAWLSAQSYPQPDVTVPVLDAVGQATGTARLLVLGGQLYVVTDSASPQRPWAQQWAELQAQAARRAEAAAAARTAGAAAVKAKSIEALREQVAALAEAVGKIADRE
jgi:hypothetical protein